MKKKIIAFFKSNTGRKFRSKELAEKLEINADYEYEELKFHLHKLVEEGIIIKQGKRYFYLPEKSSGKLTGKLSLSADGSYGFVILENLAMNDIFIAERNLGTALDGDEVEVSLFASKKGKNTEGQIINIINRAKTDYTGVLKKSNSFYIVVPDKKVFPRDIYVAENNLNGAGPNDKVVVELLEWNGPQVNPEGCIIEILGKAGDYDTEIVSLAREFNLKYKFSEDVITQADNISESIPEEEIRKRTDFREKIVITIDPEDAKDYDDALSIEKLANGNFLVGIHIADVSHYVSPESAIFREAEERATSVYFVGKVIPMLPERLSNNICSLVPGKDRLCYSVIAEITPGGKVTDYRIEKTVINSKRRYSYEEAQAILDSGKGDFFAELSMLLELSRKLRTNRIRKGSINFKSSEVKFRLDDKGSPVSIEIKHLLEANNLIEEYMLLANQIVAAHIKNNKKEMQYPFVYRIHDLPDKVKIDEFAVFVKTLGYSFTPGQKNDSKQLQMLLEKTAGTDEEAVINEVAIRSMAKAIYSTENIGHFGLAFKYYTHFTSPIRRFPDLIVHRIIFDYIKNPAKPLFTLKQLEEICAHSSACERSAASAERLSVKLKQLEYFKDKTGMVFEGIVSGVAKFGLFVQLKDTLTEGLIPMRNLADDFYILDEKNHCLIGRSTKRKFRLGDKINVKVMRVDLDKKEIDFILNEK